MPLPGEPPGATQARYVASMLALAARHGVRIDIVE
jgi:hypothetical protein